MRTHHSLVQIGLALFLLIFAFSNLSAQPGTPIPPTAAVKDQKPGSVLFFNYVTSNSSSPGTQNTDLAITNTSSSSGVSISYFLVNGQTGAVANHNFICLTPNATSSFLASDLAPGVTGYFLAVAVDNAGCPLSFNYLIGDEYIKLATNHKASLNAEAFAAIYNGSLACTSTATLAFDGVSYNAAPRALALDKFGSLADNNQAILIVNRFGGDLTSTVSPAGTFFGQLFDKTTNSYNFAFAGGAQFTCPLNDSFPLIAPAFSNVIPTGNYGWMQFWATGDVAVLGAAFNYNKNIVTSPGFTGGQNLHKLTLTNSASFIIPVTIPPC